MVRVPNYNSQDVIEQAEKRAAPYAGVDLRSILRGAFIVEDGLRAYLYRQRGCVFVERNGKFSLMAVRGKDRGRMLAKNVEFLEMLEIALHRTVEE